MYIQKKNVFLFMCYNLIIITSSVVDRLRLLKKLAAWGGKFCKIWGRSHCKMILPTTSSIHYDQGSDDQFEVGDDRRGKGSSPPGLPPGPASLVLLFFLSSAFLGRARQLHITYQLIAFLNIRAHDKRLKLPSHCILRWNEGKKHKSANIFQNDSGKSLEI